MASEALKHFKRVTKTSTVVDLGPTIPGNRAAGEVPSRPDGISKTYSECCELNTFNTSSLTALQAKLVIRLFMAGPRRLQPPASTTHLVVSNQVASVPPRQ